jgi:hypothetical protein
MNAIEIRALNHLRRRTPYRTWGEEVTEFMWEHLPTRNIWKYIQSRFKDAGPGLKRVSIRRSTE